MPEPITSSSTAVGLVMVGGISAVSLLAGLDAGALIGSFAGAAVFVLRAKEMGLLVRSFYFLTSMIAGYIASAELVRLTVVHDRGVAALVAAALVVTILNRGMDWAASMNFSDLVVNVGEWLSKWKGPKQ